MKKIYNSPKFIVKLYDPKDIITASGDEELTITPSDPNELPPAFIN